MKNLGRSDLITRIAAREIPLLSKPDTFEFFEFEIGAPPDRHPASGPLVELELSSGMILRILSA